VVEGGNLGFFNLTRGIIPAIIQHRLPTVYPLKETGKTNSELNQNNSAFVEIKYRFVFTETVSLF
jgi:hypothetical protein